MSDSPQYRYGKPMCSCMIETLPMIETRLRDAGAIRQDLAGLVTQGGYSRGKYSAGTHAKGGAIDVAHSLANTPAKVRLWRTCGVAMWERTELDSPSFGPGNRHGHGIWIGCPHLHPEAEYQVRAYRNGRDGLVNNRADRYPRPPIVTWQQALAEWRKQQAPDTPTPRPEPKEWDEMASKKEIQEAVEAAVKAQIPAIAAKAAELAADAVWAERTQEYIDENGNKRLDQRSRGHVLDSIHRDTIKLVRKTGA